jgi:GalNAc-alpha-(1->4)-GalNAc-alpha-(1->3)-diNAcBac-PP-undecaprenol alpha-1,4-N-acetyl-D-galactosaminyltransferase
MERVMSELARFLSTKEELQLHLILYGKSREIFYTLPGNVIIHKPDFRFNNKYRLFFTLRTIGFLRKKISSIKPDTVLSFGEYWNNFVLLATLFLKFPIYVSDRSQPNKSLGKLHDLLRKQLYARASGVIVQSQKAYDIYENKFKGLNIKVIGNPIRNINLQTSLKKENQILMVGRLIKTKHHDNLIKIFASCDNEPLV